MQKSSRKSFLHLLLFISAISCAGCFKWDFWNKSDTSQVLQAQKSRNILKKLSTVPMQDSAKVSDKGLASIMRMLEQADAVHREVWRVVTEQNLAVTKTPFGKAQRALVTYQNKPLSNKGLFLCDRYSVKRDIYKLKLFPQKFEIFENCKRDVGAQRILASIYANTATELSVTFYPSALEEILGLGPAILNKPIVCKLMGSQSGGLMQMKCSDWAQNKDQEQMYGFDRYEFDSNGTIMIQILGKLHENLRELRKLEVKIPAQGEILVTETELHPPEATPSPVQPKPEKPVPPKPMLTKDGIPTGVSPEEEASIREINRQAEEERLANGGKAHSVTPLPGSDGHVPLQRFIETDQGMVPADEAGNPLPQDPETGEYIDPEGSAIAEPDEDLNMYPPEGVPADETVEDQGNSVGGQNLPSPDLPQQYDNQNSGDRQNGTDQIDMPIPPPRTGPPSGGGAYGN